MRETVVKDASILSVQVTDTPPLAIGQVRVLTVRVRASSADLPAPTGTVTFQSAPNATPFAQLSLDGNGAAGPLGVGPYQHGVHTIIVQYSGDANEASATETLTLRT